MNIVLTGSLGNIGRPLTRNLVAKGHQITVISSTAERIKEIEALGAVPAIGSIQDAGFLSEAFRDADAVYLMEAWEGIGSIYDKEIDFPAEFRKIGENYREAVQKSGVRRIVHLSSIGAHSDQGTGSLLVHHQVENILRTLPEEVSITFMRPVGFFSNIYRWMPMIRSRGAIVQTYGGDRKEPWVSVLDIADAVTEEMENPSKGRTVRYLASEEISPNEIAAALGRAIGNPGLKWEVIAAEELLGQLHAAGVNEWIAQGLVQMQKAQGDGSLYEDFYRRKPHFGKVSFTVFAEEFAQQYNR
ncbi:NAD(P)H-binding protein [uncultured Chryseobacterium sp.]|uniref:NmrA family NAD(P)-binding protein n=1 Tax=uncultured Chryseobacterium sp. TaxID=259322 RepID=UPI0025E8D3F2|nr:NAD(P)H-binding protein [uncultured Chryseobacterium sp.]